MKVYINGKIYDAEKEPIVLVWDNDIARELTARQISNMQLKKGVRMYCQHPDGMDAGSIHHLLDVTVRKAIKK